MTTNKSKMEQLVKDGHITCANWKRGCFNDTNGSTRYCQTCRTHTRVSDKKRRDTKHSTATEYNQNNSEFMCKLCGDIEHADIFDTVTMKCSTCSQKSKLSCKLRNPRDFSKTQLYNYRKSACNRNLDFNLTNDEFIKLVESSCHYCGYNGKVIGVDRIDSAKGYIIDNVVPCCELCNLMKHVRSYQDFIDICEHISVFNKQIDGKLSHKLFIVSANGQYSAYKNSAEKRNISFELSKKEFKNIVLKACTYCGTHEQGYYGDGAGGIDRVDSSGNYIMSNCVSCCGTCNIMKLNYPLNVFINHCVKITKWQKIYKQYEQSTISALGKFYGEENIERLNPTFFHSNDYYEQKKWNGTINDIVLIKIDLEFVENSEQKDTWNYFRWSIASMKPFDNKYFAAKTICVLVKDSVTNKYLGIISLDSNFDKNNTHNINQTMNLSSCISVQPFGYNFNGGKLLTQLAFGKQIATYYKQKFGQKLVTIVATSLYGKSTQYNKLPDLTFSGEFNIKHPYDNFVVDQCEKYLYNVHNIDTSSFNKINIITTTISMLKLNKEKMMSCVIKGTYIGTIQPNPKTTLKIFNDWMDNCAILRFSKLTNIVEQTNNCQQVNTSRHLEKKKKDMGNDKFQEFIHAKNNKSFVNKTQQINNLIVKQPNIKKIHVPQIIEIKSDSTDTFKLPPHISIFSEKSKYHLQFSKNIDGVRYCKKQIIKSNDLQLELDNFIDLINELYKDKFKIIKHKLVDVPDQYKNMVATPINQTDIKKPIMPTNFSICRVNDIDYIQFCKKIDNKKCQYKTKINSYNLKSELDQFITQLNNKYDFGLVSNDYPIINNDNWKTTNAIVDHVDTPEKLSSRAKALKCLAKKKELVGIDVFRAQKAEYAKKYRNKHIEV
jgi:hypothetical protein